MNQKCVFLSLWNIIWSVCIYIYEAFSASDNAHESECIAAQGPDNSIYRIYI